MNEAQMWTIELLSKELNDMLREGDVIWRGRMTPKFYLGDFLVPIHPHHDLIRHRCDFLARTATCVKDKH